MYIIRTENVQTWRLHLAEYLKVQKKRLISVLFFFFLRTSLREMCCFFTCLKKKMCLSILLRSSNGLEKEFNNWEVEGVCPNVARAQALQMS